MGPYLVPRLVDAGFEVRAWSRSPRPSWAAPLPVAWETVDLERGRVERGASHLFHLAPLWLLPPLVPSLAGSGLRRILAFGSTSRFTKESSTSARERSVSRRLAEAEEALAAACRPDGIAWTVFRPTLIYDGVRDTSVASISRFVRRFGFFPLAGGALGRRQPVHADDLAQACVLAEGARPAFGRAYDLVGGATLSYREMVETVFRSLGRRPRLLRLPVPLLRTLLRMAALLPSLGHLTPDMADRMAEDLCFDSEEARRDFGYQPRPFRLGPRVVPA